MKSEVLSRIRDFLFQLKILVFKDEWRSEIALSECIVSFEDEASLTEGESKDIGFLGKVSMEWGLNSRKLDSGESSEVPEDERISMDSGGIPFLEIGKISIEENNWTEEVYRKHEVTSR